MAIVTKNTKTLITEAISIPSALLLLLLLPTTTDTFPLAAARCMTPSIESTSLTFYTPLHTQEAATHQIISIEYKKNRRGKGLKPATFPFNSSWLPVDIAIRSFLFLEARRSITSVWCRHEMKSSAFSIPSIPNIIPWQQFQTEGKKKKKKSLNSKNDQSASVNIWHHRCSALAGRWARFNMTPYTKKWTAARGEEKKAQKSTRKSGDLGSIFDSWKEDGWRRS